MRISALTLFAAIIIITSSHAMIGPTFNKEKTQELFKLLGSHSSEVTCKKIEQLVAEGADVNAFMKPDKQPWFVFPKRKHMLSQAILTKKPNEILVCLLDLGADVNLADPDWNYTPLHFAVEKCDLLAVHTLLSHRAHVNAQTKKYEESPLYRLIVHHMSYRDIIKAPKASKRLSLIQTIAQHLIVAGAEVNTPNIIGNTIIDRLSRDWRLRESNLLHMLKISKGFAEFKNIASESDWIAVRDNNKKLVTKKVNGITRFVRRQRPVLPPEIIREIGFYVTSKPYQMGILTYNLHAQYKLNPHLST